jgi:hypothetical protein
MGGIRVNMDPEILRQLLSYDPETGSLTWLLRDESFFKKSSDAKRWNSRYAGTEAFTTVLKGYRKGSILGADCYAHRVCWALRNGNWPAGEIDHINGNRSDNRICNLRDVDSLENQKNLSLRRDNKANRIGVSWYSRGKKWTASITVNKKWIFLGRFSKICDAIQARQIAEIEFGFHKNHGKIKKEIQS